MFRYIIIVYLCIHILIVIIQNLERYLERTFQEQTFLPTAKIVRSTENEVELILPTEAAQTQGYKILTHTECRVSLRKIISDDNEHCDCYRFQKKKLIMVLK